MSNKNHASKKAVDALRRQSSKTTYGIASKELGTWVTVEVFKSEAKRDAYYTELVRLNPDHELRRINL